MYAASRGRMRMMLGPGNVIGQLGSLPDAIDLCDTRLHSACSPAKALSLGTKSL